MDNMDSLSPGLEKVLRDQIEELEGEKSRLLSKVSFNQVEINKSKEDLDKLTQKLNDTQKIKNELDSKLDKLNDELIEKNREIKRLSNDNLDKDEEIERLKSKYKNLLKSDDRIEELENTIAKLQKELEDSKNKIGDNQNSYDDEIRELKEKLNSKISIIETRDKDAKYLSDKIDELNTENKELTKKNNEFTNSIKSREIEIRELQKQVNELAKKNKDSNLSPIKSPLISSFESTGSPIINASSRKEIEEVERKSQFKIDELTSKINELTKENNNYLDQIKKLKENSFSYNEEERKSDKEKISELNSKIADYLSQIEKLKLSQNDINKASSVDSDKINELNTKNSDYVIQIEKLKSSLETKENELKKFEAENKLDKEKINELNGKINEYLSHIQKLKDMNNEQLSDKESAKITSLETQIMSDQQKINDLNSKIIEYLSTIDKLKLSNSQSLEESSKQLLEKDNLINSMKLKFDASLAQNKEFYEEKIKNLVDSQEKLKSNLENNNVQREDDFEVKFMNLLKTNSSLESQKQELNNKIIQLETNEKILEENIKNLMSLNDNFKTECLNLKENIKDKDNVISSISNELNQKKLLIVEKENEIIKLKSEFNKEKIKKEEELFQMKLNLQDYTNQIESLKHSNKLELNDIQLSHHKTLLLKDNEIQKLKDQIDSLSKANHDLITLNNTYEETMKNYQEANSNSSAVNTTNSSKFNYLIKVKENEIVTLTSKINELNSVNNELVSKNKDLSLRISELTTKNKDLEDKVNSLNEKFLKKNADDNNNLINLLNNKESELQEEYQYELKNLKQNYTNEINLLNNTIKSKEDNYIKFKNLLNENLNQEKLKLNEIQLKYEKLNDEHIIVVNENNFLKNSVSTYEDKLKKKEAMINSLNEKNLELSANMNELSNNLEELKLEALCNSNKNLMKKNNDLAKNALLLDENSQLNSIKINSDGDYEAIFNNTKLVLKDIEEYNNMKQLYEKKINELKETIKGLHTALKNKSTENQQLNENLQNNISSITSNSLSLISKTNDTNTINNDFFFTPQKNDDDFMTSLSEIYSEKKKINELKSENINQDDLLTNLMTILYGLSSSTCELKLFSLHSNYHFRILYQKLRKNVSSSSISSLITNLNEILSKRINFESNFLNQLEDLINKKAKNFIKKNRTKIVEYKKLYKNKSNNKKNSSSSTEEKDMINQLTNNINGVIRLVRYVQTHLDNRKEKLDDLKRDSEKLKRSSQIDSKFESILANVSQYFTSLESSLIQFNEEVTTMSRGLMTKDSSSAEIDTLEPEIYTPPINYPESYHPPYPSGSHTASNVAIPQTQQPIPIYYSGQPAYSLLQLPIPPTNPHVPSTVAPPSYIPTTSGPSVNPLLPINLVDPKQIELQYLMQNQIQNLNKLYEKPRSTESQYYQLQNSYPSTFLSSDLKSNYYKRSINPILLEYQKSIKNYDK